MGIQVATSPHKASLWVKGITTVPAQLTSTWSETLYLIRSTVNEKSIEMEVIPSQMKLPSS
jgi:hypothetical protein